MSLALRRVSGVSVVLVGIALALWLTFGPPQHWNDTTRLWRLPLGLTVMGAIYGGTRLLYPPRD
ncbi:hypothetical protein I3F58_09615 [Streptomyces sp. MUM 203J]|uniref:hypothetical protein n=1 Tax=Streptomyces sp. MUM 203J TaxID=2791990 RepID=UPI001F03CFB7|nr:hypothetical protein [Streptomyces sp. MUM 203J]MCH0539817.1 hypothetical protein [Streptomyces sp. MUM 203J]